MNLASWPSGRNGSSRDSTRRSPRWTWARRRQPSSRLRGRGGTGTRRCCAWSRSESSGRRQTRLRVGDVVEIDNRVAVVRFIGSGRAQVDFNHRLAGKTLIYDIEAIRKVEAGEDTIRSLMKRRFPGEGEKIEFTQNAGEVSVTIPEDAFLVEGLQFIKRGIANDVLHFVPEVEKVTFTEVYPRKEPVKEKERPKEEEAAAEPAAAPGAESEATQEKAEGEQPAEQPTRSNSNSSRSLLLHLRLLNRSGSPARSPIHRLLLYHARRPRELAAARLSSFTFERMV